MPFFLDLERSDRVDIGPPPPLLVCLHLPKVTCGSLVVKKCISHPPFIVATVHASVKRLFFFLLLKIANCLAQVEISKCHQSN